MSGTSIGYLKGKLGVSVQTKAGELITAMNRHLKYKLGSSMEPKEHLTHFKCKVCGAMHKSKSALTAHMKSHKMSYKIKKTGKSFGKSNNLGGGGRFQQVKHAVAGKKGVYNPGGLAAYIGRRSLGKARFQRLAAAGKKRA